VATDMFTGIIECTGTIKRLVKEGSNIHMWVASPISQALKIDQSVAHDGVCLTVTHAEKEMHSVTIIEESLQRSHLASMTEGRLLNLERSLTLQTRLDGHIVQGHVDGVITCVEREDVDGSWRFRFQFPKEQAHLLIDKGSVCINGVSLTLIRPEVDTFEVAIIPYTFEHTNFHHIQPGDTCNIEYDIIGKYLARWRTLND
jgi:riboflavin synthase